MHFTSTSVLLSVRESLSRLPVLHSYLARWREPFFIIVLVFAELSWFSVGRRSHRTVLEKRPSTAYFLFWPHKHAHRSQVSHQFPKSLFSSIVSSFYSHMFFFFNFILYSHHLLAQWMCIRGDYRSAMTHEKEALTAFTCLVRISALMQRSVLVCVCSYLSVSLPFAVSVWRGSLSDTMQHRVPIYHHQTSCESGALSQTGRS